MFLRFGQAVGNVGLLGAILIIVLGHLITIPTGLAISEIATNLKVGGGGEYYLISRSFGTRIGASIGTMLFASQVISIAFYVIALAEGFEPMVPWIEEYILGYSPIYLAYDPRMISLPIFAGLYALIYKKGAKIGINLLWGVFVLLLIGIMFFLFGNLFMDTAIVAPSSKGISFTESIEGGDGWITMFAICFPAFTGMTAGVGLSGDLKNPKKSIPNGIMLAILMGFITYIIVVIKLYYSASVEDLAANPLIMFDIAGRIGPFGGKNWYIPLGGIFVLIALFSATLSSAVGSILIGPRTLQALGSDKVIPNDKVTNFVGRGWGDENEPRNALAISGIVVFIFLIMGNLNVVAQIITMFFMITYGSVCLISFLEHFAGNPSYRPTFRTKWYFSLLGALLCFFVMVQLSVLYSSIAFGLMIVLYISLGFTHKESRSFAIIFQSVMFQLSRFMKIALQKSQSKPDEHNWRPSIIAISSHAVERSAPKDILKWISHHYGFGTLIHYIRGRLTKKSAKEARRVQKELVSQLISSKANYTVSNVISPSFTTAVAQSLQISGVSGLDNNSILFEFNRNRAEELPDIVEGLHLAEALDFNQIVLRSTEHNFGYHDTIHIWIRKDDEKNGNLMILIGFIIMEHDEWKDSEITIFTAFPEGDKEVQVKKIRSLISKGRLPISVKNVKSLLYTDEESFKKILYNRSENADLTIMGFTPEDLEEKGAELFQEYEGLQETLFVSAGEDIFIS